MSTRIRQLIEKTCGKELDKQMNWEKGKERER